MSCAVGSFALAFESVWALFRRPTGRGRTTEGEVGEAALLLLSLDCELPIVCVRARDFLVPSARGQQQPSPSPWLGEPSVGCVVFARLQAAHAVAANGTRGRCSGRGESQRGWLGLYDGRADSLPSVPPGSNLDAAQ